MDVVDLLTGLFDANGFAVEACAGPEAARARIDAGGVDAVMVGWPSDASAVLYRWVARDHRELRRRFVFVVEQLPAELREQALRRHAVPLDDLVTLLAVAAEVTRAARPRMLLVDDDPDQLGAMALFLEEAGFEISTAGSGKEATAMLARAAYDVILSDWQMPDGSGRDLHDWIARARPALLHRLVFITGGDVEAARAHADDVVVVPKGQDSQHLLEHLARACAAAPPPPE
ncbi:MAG: response regulator [Kofleriaceae bacterium]|nr:response regulator [Myxococcales bacterium]MCB9563007.1 response regulator [Kofleriaceae bacterium]